LFEPRTKKKKKKRKKNEVFILMTKPFISSFFTSRNFFFVLFEHVHFPELRKSKKRNRWCFNVFWMVFDQELKNNFIEKWVVKIFLKNWQFWLYTLYNYIWDLEVRFSECAWHIEWFPISCNIHKYDQTSK